MRRLDAVFALLVLGLLGAAIVFLAPAADRATGFPRVVDGDTLALDGRRLRLAGLDAPEMAQVCLRDGAPYRCGIVARDALVALLAGGPVACTIAGRDRYGRDLAACRVGGEDIGAILVRRGLAVSYGRYLAEEREARRSEIGLWAGRFDRPDAWRRAHEPGVRLDGGADALREPLTRGGAS